jgi:hypothetical protein
MRITSWCFLVVLALIESFLTEGSAAQTLQESPGQVWQVGERRWDTTQEQRFAEWVEKTITEDFFIRHGIAVDCADVPYAIRWIYARIAHLPAAVTTGDGRLLGHWSNDWEHLPTAKEWYLDRRFCQSLREVLRLTSTRTLPLDTYPIRITDQSLSAGAVFIGEGHAGLVGRIVQDGSTYSPVQTWEATLPRKVTQLRQSNYVATWADKDAGNGLVRFRWPVFVAGRWQYLPNQDHPYYSLEQYSSDFCRDDELFDQAVARRIDPKQYDPATKSRLIIDSIYRYLLVRAALVNEGYKHCRQKNCPEGSYLWEVYSTPARDDLIDFEIYHLQKLIKDNQLDEEAFAKTMEGMVIPVDAGHSVTLNYVVQNHSWLSHNPDDSIEARWALAKCGTIRSRMQISLEALDFIEQRYRFTDPEYADHRRKYISYELKMLHDQGKSAGCDDLQQLPRDESKLLPTTMQIRK